MRDFVLGSMPGAGVVNGGNKTTHTESTAQVTADAASRASVIYKVGLSRQSLVNSETFKNFESVREDDRA